MQFTTEETLTKYIEKYCSSDFTQNHRFYIRQIKQMLKINFLWNKRQMTSRIHH